ncbi:MAG: hypothetical protein MR593_01500 [Intestinibacter sp.]|uniref:hypothetical protein n=1 Tax=Intestinibacter sp. TaxID=1965304 RepID=UPI0025B85C66|nr:hypothetical protein [Intestinibacter sp.]MCI6736784.1 hypothetical protein [Intestinibacter sp.]
MKKLISIIACFILCLSFVGCSSDAPASNVSSSDVKSKNQEDKNKEEIVLVDNDYATVTITEKYEDMGEIGYKVTIVNKTKKKHLMVAVEDVSVDGVMNDPFWATDITAGKTDYSEIYWFEDGEDNKNVKSIDDLKNVEGKITISDYDEFETYSEDEFELK